MSFGIIIKGDGNSKRFKPHYNIATNKYYNTKKEYLGDLKKMNLVPYEKPKENEGKEIKATSWGRDMVKAVKRADGNMGSAYYDQMAKKGYSREKIAKALSKKNSSDFIDNSKGGFF